MLYKWNVENRVFECVEIKGTRLFVCVGAAMMWSKCQRVHSIGSSKRISKWVSMLVAEMDRSWREKRTLFAERWMEPRNCEGAKSKQFV
uniref:Uncharacterized protein n=1 Tax=Anopheles minimus TaxID=112268 RepID=A0A182WQE2_9DIPT